MIFDPYKYQCRVVFISTTERLITFGLAIRKCFNKHFFNNRIGRSKAIGVVTQTGKKGLSALELQES